MVPKILLDHYRLSTIGEDGPPKEIGRNGPATTYKGSDLRSGAPVALTLVPVESVDPAEREQFEEAARAATSLDHINIARTVAFGTTDDFFVFVSEYPQGETVEAWVNANGPMPADAVLRIARQVVAALGAASFHGLNHPAIQPSNLVIVSGKTAEGGWPFVKLTHFALAGLKSAPGLSEPTLGTSDFASPEQLLQGKVDFRSEIYSLGATMCFLLTGVFYSAYPRSPQTKRFGKPLRTLIARTLEDDPEKRPQDPVLFTEELRSCLAAVERRQKLRRQFGLPFPPVVAKPPRPRPLRRQRPTPLMASLGPTAPQPAPQVVRSSRIRPVWQIAAGVVTLLAVGLIAALFLPEDVVTAALHRKKSVEAIGVPVGVPDASPTTMVQANNNPPLPASQTSHAENVTAAETSQSPGTDSKPAATPESTISQSAVIAQNSPPPDQSATSTVRQSPESQGTRSGPPLTAMASGSAPASGAAASNKSELVAPESSPPARVAANDLPSAPAPPAEAPSGNAENQSDQQVVSSQSNEEVDTAQAAPSPEPRVTEAKPAVSDSSASKSPIKKSGSVAESKGRSKPRVPRALRAEPSSEAPVRSETVRARVVGTTPGGNLILLMPNGDRAIVTPEDAEAYTRLDQGHRKPRRVIIEKRTYPPQNPAAPYQPFLPPD